MDDKRPARYDAAECSFLLYASVPDRPSSKPISSDHQVAPLREGYILRSGGPRLGLLLLIKPATFIQANTVGSASHAVKG
ncbi:unnamed protein product [Ascophyllum nodosum]